MTVTRRERTKKKTRDKHQCDIWGLHNGGDGAVVVVL